jgi:hypothetical protein
MKQWLQSLNCLCSLAHEDKIFATSEELDQQMASRDVNRMRGSNAQSGISGINFTF